MKNKQRTTIWMSPEVMNQLNKMSTKNNSKSRSEFIERAIKFYDGYNHSTVENQYLPIALSSALNRIVKVSEDRLSKLLFQNTVELAMMMNVLSATIEIDNATLKKLRVKCINEIKGTNGKISFEEVNRYKIVLINCLDK